MFDFQIEGNICVQPDRCQYRVKNCLLETTDVRDKKLVFAFPSSVLS